MGKLPLNWSHEVTPSVTSVPGFVRVLHPEMTAEALQRLFVDFVTNRLKTHVELQSTATSDGSQLTGNYGGERTLLFVTTLNDGFPHMVYGSGEEVLYQSASHFTARSVVERASELDKLVADFGRHILNSQTRELDGPRPVYRV